VSRLPSRSQIGRPDSSAQVNPWRHPFRVPRVEKPRTEGRLYLPNGRRLGYAEYGDPAGAVVLWCTAHPADAASFLCSAGVRPKGSGSAWFSSSGPGRACRIRTPTTV